MLCLHLCDHRPDQRGKRPLKTPSRKKWLSPVSPYQLKLTQQLLAPTHLLSNRLSPSPPSLWPRPILLLPQGPVVCLPESTKSLSALSSLSQTSLAISASRLYNLQGATLISPARSSWRVSTSTKSLEVSLVDLARARTTTPTSVTTTWLDSLVQVWVAWAWEEWEAWEAQEVLE